MNESAVVAPRIVCVLGMHRSGTSAITRALEVLGVELGDHLMPGQSNDNAKGFFEDLDVSAFNIELMNSKSMTWDSLAPADIGVSLQQMRPDMLARAVVLLRQKTHATTLYGVKDPRLCRLLPFWREASRLASLPMACIVCLRDPLSVAASLSKRDGFCAAKSVYLWLLHMVAALEHSVGESRILVSFDALLASPARELKRIASLLCTAMPSPEEAAYTAFCGGFLDESMRHASHSLEEVMASTEIAPAIKELYAALYKCASEDATLDSAWISDALIDARRALDGQAALLDMAAAFDAKLEDLQDKDLERAALYWCGQDEEFDEKRSIVCEVDVQAIGASTLVLGDTVEVAAQFRLDPLERPGMLVISGLAAISSTGAVLQRIGSGGIAGCSSGFHIWWFDEQSFLAICHDGDPGLKLNIPNGTRGVSFSARRPQPADFMVLLQKEQGGPPIADELQQVAARLDRTQTALDEVQSMAIHRAEQLQSLHGRLAATETALGEAQRLAIERVEQVNIVQQALDSAQAMFAMRNAELQQMSAQLQHTQAALDEAQAMAIQRAEKLQSLHTKLAVTETALGEAQRLAIERAEESRSLHVKLVTTETALDEAQRLAHARAAQVDTMQEAHNVIQASLAQRDVQLQESRNEAMHWQGMHESIARFWAWRVVAPLWRRAQQRRAAVLFRKR